MASTPYQRFAITVPERLASQIERARAAEGRNRSEFFREAVRVYFATQSRELLLMPTSKEEQVGSPFPTFMEWTSEADNIYDTLR